MKTEQLPIYRITYEFISTVISCTKNYSKDYKFNLAEKINKESFEIIDNIYRANVSYSRKFSQLN